MPGTSDGSTGPEGLSQQHDGEHTAPSAERWTEGTTSNDEV